MADAVTGLDDVADQERDPDIDLGRWIFVWLFVPCFGIAAADASAASERAGLAYLPFFFVSLAVAGVVAVAWRRNAGWPTVARANRRSTLLTWFDRVPNRFVRFLHLVALIGLLYPLLARRLWGWDSAITDPVQSASMSLLMLALVCGPRPFRFRR